MSPRDRVVHGKITLLQSYKCFSTNYTKIQAEKELNFNLWKKLTYPSQLGQYSLLFVGIEDEKLLIDWIVNSADCDHGVHCLQRQTRLIRAGLRLGAWMWVGSCGNILCTFQDIVEKSDHSRLVLEETMLSLVHCQVQFVIYFNVKILSLSNSAHVFLKPEQWYRYTKNMWKLKLWSTHSASDSLKGWSCILL